MPASLQDSLYFLETQWSSINDNKVNGILAELAFKNFLHAHAVHYVPGGWIMIPGNCSLSPIPARNKVCLLPRSWAFQWQGSTPGVSPTMTLAELAAYNYFGQVGVTTYFVTPVSVNPAGFQLPTRRAGRVAATYRRPYTLDFSTLAPSGQLQSVHMATAFAAFPRRAGTRGLRCHARGRLSAVVPPWTDASVVADLFWMEYTKYYVQVDYLASNNDLDLFIIGRSGACYPVELKAKAAAFDRSLGHWFGIDMGPFAKLSFFTANSMNTDALYVVQEVDGARNHIDWYGIRFTDLVKSCSWVGQAGGTNMMGGASSTFKVPKAAFTPLTALLPTL